jgi:acyl dehydratase
VAVTMDMAELAESRDVDLGVSDWLEVTQSMIDGFADATLDHQWIHVDEQRAAEGPFGTTVAHGYLTLSLLPVLVGGLLEVPDAVMGVNYGLDRLRLTAPVKSGSRVRASAHLTDTELKGGGLLCRIEVTVEIEGQDRPALVATTLSLRYAA